MNVANSINPNAEKNLQDDIHGEQTIEFLKRTRKVARRINSNHASSLGLHPMVYFYSQDGRYKVASFFAITDLILDLDKRGKINEFIKARSEFESLILKYDYLVQQINRKYRSVQASYKYISSFFKKNIELINKGKTCDQAVNEIINSSEYNYITLTQDKDYITGDSDFSTTKKNAIYIKEAIQNAPRCKICEGLIHRNSISIDHIQRKEDGGLASLDNGQLTHPYCNTGFKN